MFPTHRVVLDWSFDRINLDPKIQTKYTDTTNQLADMLTKGNFTRDKLNHLLCLFNIGHFSSAECSEVTSKRTQKDSGEERVTAKSKPIVNLVSQCSEKTLVVLPSTASEGPAKIRHETQTPLNPQIETYDGTVRPIVNAQHADRFIIENDETNSILTQGEWSSAEEEKQSSKDATKDRDKQHSILWGMFKSSTLEASVFMEKITQTIGIP